MKKSWILGLIAVLLLASCQSSGAALHQYTKGALLASYNFDQPGSFEQGAYTAATLQVISSAYEIDVLQGDNVLWWGQWGDTYGDTMIDVDTEQLSDRPENAYGIMCRVQGTVGQKQPVDPLLAAIMSETETPEATAEATSGAAATSVAVTAQAASAATVEATAAATAQVTEALKLPTPALTATVTPAVVPTSSGDGYLFLIQGGGSFAIMRSRGRNLTPLVDWKGADAIKQGPAQNHLRAICAGNYLAFYVNDTFLGDATDDTYTSGQVGMAASAATRLGTRIVFDNLTVSVPVAGK